MCHEEAVIPNDDIKVMVAKGNSLCSMLSLTVFPAREALSLTTDFSVHLIRPGSSRAWDELNNVKSLKGSFPTSVSVPQTVAAVVWELC